MNNRTDHGFLVLADVSGFTAFVTTTELEHGSDIIATLLDGQGARVDGLVNVIGPFDGSKGVQIRQGGVYLVSINADGAWT